MVEAGGAGSSAHVRTPSVMHSGTLLWPHKGSCIMGQWKEGQFCDLTKGGYRVVKGLRARSPPDGGQRT